MVDVGFCERGNLGDDDWEVDDGAERLICLGIVTFLFLIEAAFSLSISDDLLGRSLDDWLVLSRVWFWLSTLVLWVVIVLLVFGISDEGGTICSTCEGGTELSVSI